MGTNDLIVLKQVKEDLNEGRIFYYFSSDIQLEYSIVEE
jgi:hypothetical protein